MIIRPIGKNILVTPIEGRRETDSGIILPAGEKTGVEKAFVNAVARGVEGVQEGDTVLYESHIRTIDAGGGRRIVKIDDVMAVLA